MSFNEQFSIDIVGKHQIAVVQPLHGHRISLDAVLVAAFTEQFARNKVVDLGCGTGFICFWLATQPKVNTVLGIDCSARNIEFARQGKEHNHLTIPLSFTCADVKKIKSFTPVGEAQTVVSNPPYRKAGSGKISPHPLRAQARHEQSATFQHFVQAAAWLLPTGGTFCFIHLCERYAEIIQTLHEYGFVVKHSRFVYPFPQKPAKQVLIAARKGGKQGMHVHPPLIVYRSKGVYSEEVKALLGY